MFKKLWIGSIFKWNLWKKKRRKGINLREDIKESSSNKEDGVFLEASYEEDTIEVTKPSYKQLFKMNTELVKENDKHRECNLVLKENSRSLEEFNKLLKIEIIKIRNSKENCETCVSLKKEVIELHETLGKFIQGK